MIKYYINCSKKSIVFIIAFIAFVFGPLPAHAIIPNDPDFTLQKAMWSQINAFDAWDISVGSKEIIVAVIDTGIDVKHPDLADNIWINQNEIPGNGIDDDNNGYIDDVNGWNFVDNNSNPFNYENDVFDYTDSYDIYTHGTVISGLIGAIGNNNIGGLGVNWKVSVMPLKAFDVFGSGSYYNIGEAINYAIKNKADILNISFVGNLDEPFLKNSLRKAYEAGILIVVAAGNNNIISRGDLDREPAYPICFDKGEENWILGVSSVDSKDRLSIFANYGVCVDILAPGEFIYSSIVKSEYGNNKFFGGPWAGTSFSTPLISGAAALIKSIDQSLTPDQIINILLSSSDDIEYINPGLAGRVGYGRLNLHQALLKAVSNTKSNYLPDRICRVQNSKIICHEPKLLRNMFVSSVNEKIISLDTFKKEKIALLADSHIKILSGDGSYEKKVLLNSGYLYKKIYFFESDAETLIAVYGDKNLSDHKIFIFDINGNIKKEIFFKENAPFALTINNDNSFSTIKIENRRIAVSHYDLDGKLIFKKFGPLAGFYGDLVNGQFWDHGNQLAFIISQNGKEILCIFDLNTGSYFLEKDNILAGNRLISIKSGEKDGTGYIFNYSMINGDYRVFDGKGEVLISGQMNF